MECRAFLAAIVPKLLTKSPLSDSLANALAAFDPRRMAHCSCDEVSQWNSFQTHVIEAGRI